MVGLWTAGARDGDGVPAWSASARLAVPRTYAQALALADGRVLLEGGIDRESEDIVRLASEIFDPRSGRSRLVPAIEGGRMWQTLTRMRDGRVLSVGGVERDGFGWSATAVATVFDPHSGAYARVAQPVVARSDHAATLLPDGRVLVVGGHDGPHFVKTVEIYDPRSDTWSEAASPPHGRSQFALVTLADGRVLLAGGFRDPGEATDATLFYDPARDAWSEGPRMSVARAIATAVSLPDGDVLFIGGQRGAAGTAERYDARRGAFVFAGTLVAPRMAAAAAVSVDGSVVLAGGLLRPQSGDGFVPTALAERWDPAANRWTALPPLRTPRASVEAVTAPGGVWLLGGSAEDDRALDSIEFLR